MADNWPKFQHSFFMDEERNGPQTVIRGDDYKEWMLDVEQARKDFGIPPLPEKYVASVVEDPVTPRQPPEEVPHPADQRAASEETIEYHDIPDEEEYWVNEVKKDGPNKGRHFKSGKKSHKFLGWTNEPLTSRK